MDINDAEKHEDDTYFGISPADRMVGTKIDQEFQDHLLMSVLTQLITKHNTNNSISHRTAGSLVEYAYEVLDAVMKEREKRNG